MWGRKHRPPRRGVHADAWITQDGDFAARKCKVLDISASGAKIRCEDQQFLKDTFRLKYAREARAGRLCRVIWRNGKQDGVAFRDWCRCSHQDRTLESVDADIERVEADFEFWPARYA